MIIKVKLKRSDFIKVMYYLTYRSRIMIYVTMIGFLMVAGGSASYFVPSMRPSEFPFMPLFFCLVVFVFLPISVYFSSIKILRNNPRLSEEIDYEFDKEKLCIIGQTFKSELQWLSVNKIEELRHWFLIYQNPRVANLIPKSAMQSEQITEFRDLMKSIPGIKLKLKK